MSDLDLCTPERDASIKSWEKTWKTQGEELRHLHQQTRVIEEMDEGTAHRLLMQMRQEYARYVQEDNQRFLKRLARQDSRFRESLLLWLINSKAQEILEASILVSKRRQDTHREAYKCACDALVKFLRQAGPIIAHNAMVWSGQPEKALDVLTGYALAEMKLFASREQVLKREYRAKWRQGLRMDVRSETAFPPRRNGFLSMTLDGLETIANFPAQAARGLDKVHGIQSGFRHKVTLATDMPNPVEAGYNPPELRAIEDSEGMAELLNLAGLNSDERQTIEAFLAEPDLMDYGRCKELAERWGRSPEKVRQDRCRAFEKIRNAREKRTA